ncbi:MAG: hypothetical protein WD825_11685 [Gemmatimonadaceae bacterium]
MKRVHHLLVTVALLGGAGAASAQTTATQNVTITVTEVDIITVAGGDVAISVGVGSTQAARTYSVTTNGTARTITGQITTGVNFPTGLTLTTNLVAPTNASSNGAVALTTTAATLVTGIANVDQSGLGITYTATATASAPTGAQGQRTITYTIVP